MNKKMDEVILKNSARDLQPPDFVSFVGTFGFSSPVVNTGKAVWVRIWQLQGKQNLLTLKKK
jgi:calcineurin-like phosphoesterase family protein